MIFRFEGEGRVCGEWVGEKGSFNGKAIDVTFFVMV